MDVFVLVGILFGLAAFQIKTSSADARNRQLPSIFGNAKVETENSGFTPDGKELYQGDMILTDEQKEWLEEPEGLRKAINEQKYRWPGAMIPFRISGSSKGDRGAILLGMGMWTQSSCVTFKEVPDNYKAPHVVFKKLDGCFSSVGRQHYAGQEISIGTGCATAGTVAHEIGHALGFHHEQCRPDRDRYVTIVYKNIPPGSIRRNFDVEINTNVYGIPYDLRSLMHYGPYAFSVNNEYTILAKDPTKQFMIGQREQLTFSDLKLVHLMYNCSSNCVTRQRCLNGGYMDRTCKCKCATGFTGSTCENTARYSPELTCGSSINSPTTIASPNYPGSYTENANCVWVVTAPPGYKVRARFQRFQMAERDNWCTRDFLEVRSKDLYDGKRFCGTELDKTSLTATGRTMVLLFSSQTSNPGFQADITFVL